MTKEYESDAERIKAKEQYQKLFENLTSGCAIYRVINDGKYGKDYIIEAFNKESLEIEDKTAEEVVGKSLFDLRPNIDEYGLIDIFRKVWATGESKHFPSKIYMDDNYSNYYENRVFKLSDDKIVAIYNDVTDLMTTQEKLKENMEKLEKYISEAPYGVFVADEKGNYLEVNKEASMITGYSECELTGMNLIQLIPDDEKQKAIESFARVKSFGADTTEIKYISKDGAQRHWRIKAIKLSETRFLGFAEDITQSVVEEAKAKKTREETKALFDHAGVGIGYYDPNGRVIWYNEVAAKNLGGKPEDFNGKFINDLFSPDEAKKYMKRLKKAIKSSRSLEYEDKVELPNADLWYKSTYNNIFSKEKKLLGVEIISHDITDIKLVQNDLEKEKTRYKLLFEDAPLGYQSLDEKGNIVEVNQAWLDMLGYKNEEVKGRFFGDFLIPEQKQVFAENFTDFKTLGAGEKVYKFHKKNGEVILVRINGRGAYNNDGSFKQSHCILEDVTEKTNKDIALKSSEERLRHSQEIANAGSWEMETGSNMVWASDQSFKLFGISTNTNLLSLKDIEKMIHEDDREMVHNTLMEFLADKPGYDVEYRIKPKGVSEYRYVRSIAEKQYDEQGKMTKILGVVIDITDQKKAAIALFKTQAFLQAAFDNSQAGIGIAEAPDCKLRYVNKAALEIRNGSEDYLVKDVTYKNYVEHWNILHLDGTPYKEDEVSIVRAILYGEVAREEHIIRRDNLEDRYVLADAAPIKDSDNNIIAGIVVFQDITERIKLEEERATLEAQIRNQQKLESIGTLASGVAHEINNPINGILNYGQVILDSTDSDSDISKYANEIINETKRVSEIVRNLLDFSRQSGKQHSYAHIEDIIAKTLTLINTIFKHDNINLNIDIEKKIPKMKCRSQQIQQVIMNLLTNARDSLNQKYSGFDEKKIVNLSCRKLEKEKRNMVRIEVEDFGIGIPKNVQNRIFDPFFTTKGKDKGTGLGLSISYGIIQEHLGEMVVESVEGEYTRFIIDLPCDNGWAQDN